MRELIVKFGKSAYVIRYRVTDEAVMITRIWQWPSKPPTLTSPSLPSPPRAKLHPCASCIP
jgi:hypothetical protein